MNNPARLFLAILAILLFSFLGVKAQLPDCNKNMIYLHEGVYPLYGIINWDPSLPFSATNPFSNSIAMPPTSGLAVSANLNSPTGPSPTFYTSIQGIYYYYNGTTWVSTGHTISTPGYPYAPNLGAGGGYVFSFNGSTGDVFRYNGTGNSIYITTVANFNGMGPYDIVADDTGNFYVLRTYPPGFLRKYSPNGVLLQSWTVSGTPNITAGGGFGIINGNVYFSNSNGLYGGPISGTNVNFTFMPSISSFAQSLDFAQCPIGLAGLTASIDTGYYCGYGPGVKVKAIGSPPFQWSVASGNATITSSGDSAVITATVTSKIAVKNAYQSDTVLIVVPTATVFAGGTDFINGCGSYKDTLNAHLKDTLTGIPYSYTWTPVQTISAGVNTLTPVINPTDTTVYTIHVSIPASKGGCTWVDSVTAIPVDLSDKPEILAQDSILCEGQGTLFTALNKVSYVTGNIWSFDDNADTFHRKQIAHTFKTAGTYTVKLTSSNTLCPDVTVSKTILVNPLPNVEILNSDIVIKYGQTVQLKAIGASIYFWTPGGSLSDANTNTPVASPKEPTLYTVIGLDQNNCRNTDSVRVSIDYSDPLLLPSAFSPNGDNLNDVFHIPNLGFRKLIEFRVFNRWGKEVFYTNDADKGWDGNYNGTPQELGVYNYIIRVAYPDGYVETNKGDVTLFR